MDASVRHLRKIVSHERNGAAKKAEGRYGHALVLELDERRNPSALGCPEYRLNISLSELWVPLLVVNATHHLASVLALRETFFSSVRKRHCTQHSQPSGSMP